MTAPGAAADGAVGEGVGLCVCVCVKSCVDVGVGGAGGVDGVENIYIDIPARPAAW